VLNRVCLIGRLTRDPELRTTTSGKNVTEFSVAVNKKYKPTEGPDADFIRITAWGSTAEYVKNYLSKGRLVAVDGRLQSRKYTAKDGSSREIVEIVADFVQALERPKDDATAAQSGPDGGDDYDPFAD